MAIYHLTTKVVARSKGHSAVAAAAYRARTELTNERTGEVWDYRRRRADVLFSGIYAPKDAPDWMQDRAQLWNAVEFSEKRKDAQVARDFIIGLPHELTEEQQRYALQDWVRENFVRKGYVADLAIHRPGEEGDQRNTHAHVLVSMRQVEGNQFAAKKERSADRLADLEKWRESWEKIGNRHLTRHGHPATLDRRSLDAQGIDRLPQIHIGKDAAEMERKGIQTDRGDTMHEIHRKNLARDLEKIFGRKATVPEFERPAATAPEMKMEPLDRSKAITEPESPWESRDPRHALRKGKGILATIWSFARNSGAAIAALIFGPGRAEPALPQEDEPFRNDDGLLAAQETCGKAQDGREAGPGPQQGSDGLERAEERTEALMTAKPAPPPLTRELTMVEKLERSKQQLVQELPRQTREQQRQIRRDLDLDL